MLKRIHVESRIIIPSFIYYQFYFCLKIIESSISWEQWILDYCQGRRIQNIFAIIDDQIVLFMTIIILITSIQTFFADFINDEIFMYLQFQCKLNKQVQNITNVCSGPFVHTPAVALWQWAASRPIKCSLVSIHSLITSSQTPFLQNHRNLNPFTWAIIVTVCLIAFHCTKTKELIDSHL